MKKILFIFLLSNHLLIAQDFKRFIFYGGAREKKTDGTRHKVGESHNSAFKFASFNVRKDYTDFKKTGSLLKISTGKILIDTINQQEDNTIISLDILSHSTAYSLNFSQKAFNNCGIYVNKKTKQFLAFKYRLKYFKKYIFDTNSVSIAKINFNKFNTQAVIELHGCKTVSRLNILPLPSIAKKISKELIKNGKYEACVIVHLQKSGPLIYEEKTKILEQDYRHGKRAVFYNGKVLFRTKKTRRISHSKILNKIQKRKKRVLQKNSKSKALPQ